MQVKLCENISENGLREIKKMIGEAFVSNELFHEFGDINTRRELVLKVKMLVRLLLALPFKTIKKFLAHVLTLVNGREKNKEK